MGKKRTYKKRTQRSAAFSISLTLGDAEYTSTGETIFDALKALEMPVKIVTKGFIHAEGEGKQMTKMLMPMEMKQFLRPIARTIQAKKIALMMK